ncbi:uncharacterized protein LOC124899524 [Capsicum annuum]|uniref:uncharacterized protein LOC124899524 n=1 Tax=Capsicum annuum TaxID=4072 RepID=UPI001FB11045|nr:uncharacterized protein LOC124899524 [Capsicum annuum]
MKKLNLHMKFMGKKRLLKLVELNEFHLHAYENAKLYKEKTKKWHDKHIIDRVLEPGQLVLLFNARLKLFSSKLWCTDFSTMKKAYLHPEQSHNASTMIRIGPNFIEPFDDDFSTGKECQLRDSNSKSEEADADDDHPNLGVAAYGPESNDDIDDI